MLKYIDLFSGCGGMSLGLYNSKVWRGLFAIEKSPLAFETLKYNLIDQKKHFDWVSWLPKRHHDINKVVRRYKNELLELRGEVDLITGGPPCQGFSTAGERKEGDKRNDLIKGYMKFVDLVRPKAIFFENVKGFTLKFKKNRTKGIAYSAMVVKKLEKLGYNVFGKLVDFSEFGIPQKRVRYILVGIRDDVARSKASDAKSFFKQLKENRTKYLLNRGLSLNVNLNEAISDLLKRNNEIASPDSKGFNAGKYLLADSSYQKYLRKNANEYPDSHRFVNHRKDTLNKFKYILKKAAPNKDIGSELKEKLNINKHTLILLDGKKPSPTLTTLTDDYIHYKEPRVLTVREYARIQSFNDWFEIKGKYTTGGKNRVLEVPRYSQIGNAIPPLFGEQSGLVLKLLVGDRK